MKTAFSVRSGFCEGQWGYKCPPVTDMRGINSSERRLEDRDGTDTSALILRDTSLNRITKTQSYKQYCAFISVDCPYMSQVHRGYITFAPALKQCVWVCECSCRCTQSLSCFIFCLYEQQSDFEPQFKTTKKLIFIGPWKANVQVFQNNGLVRSMLYCLL